MNEEESRDRKQSGTEGKGRRIKTRREGNRDRRGRERKKEERAREARRTKPGAIARSEDPPLAASRESKKKERSKVRASGPDTDRFSCDIDEEEGGAGRKEDKRIYLPVQARISASSKISASGQMVSTAFIGLTDPSKK